MGYNSDIAMDDAGLRDTERWKDQIEVRLDNRQVFFLFFGSALVACFLFVLGVVVGKRLESRGHAVSPEIEDPLALLDKISANGQARRASLGDDARGLSERNHDRNGQASSSFVPAKKTPKMGLQNSNRKRIEPRRRDTVSAKVVPVKAVPKQPEPKKFAPKALPKPKPTRKAAASEAPVRKPRTKSAPSMAPQAPLGDKNAFTLQIRAYKSQAEAVALAKRFRNAGAYVIKSVIPGKGIWYRVRVGQYKTGPAALRAKTAFENKNGIIAYVVSPAAQKRGK